MRLFLVHMIQILNYVPSIEMEDVWFLVDQNTSLYMLLMILNYLPTDNLCHYTDVHLYVVIVQ